MLNGDDAFNMGNISFLSYTEATGAIKNGPLDGSIILASTLAAAFIELFTTEDATLIPVEAGNVEGLLEDYPYYEMVEIPAGTYEGQEAAVSAVGDPAILFISADADEEMIRNITAALFDNLDALGQVHPAARKITVENGPNAPIELHPGAQVSVFSNPRTSMSDLWAILPRNDLSRAEYTLTVAVLAILSNPSVGLVLWSAWFEDITALVLRSAFFSLTISAGLVIVAMDRPSLVWRLCLYALAAAVLVPGPFLWINYMDIIRSGGITD